MKPRLFAPQPVRAGPLAALLEWQAMSEGETFCKSRGDPYLPADPKTVRAFIVDRMKVREKPATVATPSLRDIRECAEFHLCQAL
jgi:hypothetical protein